VCIRGDCRATAQNPAITFPLRIVRPVAGGTVPIRVLAMEEEQGRGWTPALLSIGVGLDSRPAAGVAHRSGSG
jgi:hypothetical protein